MSTTKSPGTLGSDTTYEPRSGGAVVAEAKIGLTIYLLKSDRVPAFDSELRQGNNVRSLAAPLDGDFIQLPSAGGEPTWGQAIRAVLQNAAGLNFDSLSPAGLLVVRRGPNTFVVTFGHAWQKVEHHWTEPQFGLRVALNSIAAPFLRTSITGLP